jgi:hypothetical protein
MNVVYLSGIIALSLKLLLEMIRLLHMVIKKRKKGNRIIRVTGIKVSGFTAFGHIFIDEVLSAGEEEEIIRHEQKHLDRGHFFDILFLEMIKLFQWFNPFVYLLDRSLRAVLNFRQIKSALIRNTGGKLSGLMLTGFKTGFQCTNNFPIDLK